MASSWFKIGSDINGDAINDNSGWSVSLSADGTILAVGSIESSNGNGYTRIYKYLSGSWSQLGSDIIGEAEGDRFGSSLSLSSDGTVLAISAIGNDENGSQTGHTRIYKYSSSSESWIQLGADINGKAGGYLSGVSISLSSDGEVVAIEIIVSSCKR